MDSGHNRIVVPNTLVIVHHDRSIDLYSLCVTAFSSRIQGFFNSSHVEIVKEQLPELVKLLKCAAGREIDCV